MEQTTSIHDALEQIRQCCAAVQGDAAHAEEARELFRSIAQAARDASRPDLAGLADLLADLAPLIQSLADAESPAEELQSLGDFLQEGVDCLAQGLQDDPAAPELMAQLRQRAESRWGECLRLLSSPGDEEFAADLAWEGGEPAELDEVPVPDESQLGLILNSLATSVIEDADAAQDPGEGSQATENRPSTCVLDDPEIREAYVDDAQCGLSSIEAALLAYESDPSNSLPLKQVCRELHTLKGASASVGLEELASFLHRVEDDLQGACEGGGSVDLQPLFQAVDAVRDQTNRCRSPVGPELAPARASTPVPKPKPFVDAGAGSQDSVRVKAAQLDRLMDMLAELVMLRNRRESRVEQLKSVHGELVRCVSRLRAYEENFSAASVLAAASQPTSDGTTHRPTLPKQRVSSLTEIANDLLELGGNLRELYEPVAEENHSISRFIRQFRQELIQLRRVPIGGLFQRLQRSARDAARAEGKKVRLQLVGEDVGLETSLQQQLYEPLLHIVRNAVSHGIEAEPQRAGSGKNPTGTVTLEAHGGANLLVITVRDDGRGLDYDALRRRGLEMGLIASDRPTSRADLARLIFHPGFSTRTDTTEISGRGVGMDVVATALERMHSWIEVDSVPGQGTTVRLLIPLHSVIEHVMVFRAGGQEFAVPTQFVRFAGDPASADTSDFPLTHLSNLFANLQGARSHNPHLLVLSCHDSAQETSSEAATRRFGLLVDEIVGPEEVVVRPLPNLLAPHRLFSGVTLSGTGDIMLLFDSQHLLQFGMDFAADPLHRPTLPNAAELPAESAGKRVLVVDDSRTARRTLTRFLRAHHCQVEEAADGVEALRRLKDQSFDLIFTDLEMPQMGGMELLREVRATSRVRTTPVIIVTSRGEEIFRKQARELGVNEYLTKPVSEATIHQTMERLQQQPEGQLA